ncbi:MAG: DUF4410 domain-containing protein [Deltaproteobacteria bacterium]|nr:DUF4410 domain-containing protein [Deltaproteobacteria bacterium]
MKHVLLAGGVAAVLTACAPTSVQETYQLDAPLRRPARILVYDFTGDASEVHLDRGIGAQIESMTSDVTPEQQKIEAGRAAARTISNELVRHLNEMGMPAQRAFGAPTHWGNSLVVEGQFVSIDEGNRTKRLVIGLGAGASDMQTKVQVYTTAPGGLQQVQDFSTNVASGMKPGMAETMGVGAAAGTLGTAAAVGAGAGIGSEAWSAGVDAEAKRTAKAIARRMQTYFVEQGWIPAPE